MRKVTDNHGVAKAWANRREARSHNGNFSTDGHTLWSYSTPIGTRATAVDGRNVFLLTSETYSVTTTGKHWGPAARAVAYDFFAVPSLGHGEIAPDHAANMAHLRAVIEAERARLKRARVYTSEGRLLQLRVNLHEYANAFGQHLETAEIMLRDYVAA